MRSPVGWLSDVSAAAWVGERLHPFGQGVGSVVPSGYERYLRVFHPVERNGERERWSEVARRNGRVVHAGMQFPAISIPPGTAPSRAQAIDPGPSAGSLPLAERRTLIEGLRGATTTPQRCWFCIWEGWGLDERGVQARVDLPGRRYLLYAGPLETALAPQPGGGPGTAYRVTWSADAVPDEVPDPPEGWQAQSPNLWWPEDRAWFVATEIDAASTYVGGSADLTERLMADPRLEALPCQLDDSLFLNSDVLNR